jgi:hypothetical protein
MQGKYVGNAIAHRSGSDDRNTLNSHMLDFVGSRQVSCVKMAAG